MPSTPFLISGTIKDSSSTPISDATITFIADSEGNTTSNSLGQYVFDLANLGYSSGDTITYSTIDKFENETNSGSFTVTGSNKTLNISLSVRTNQIRGQGNITQSLINIGGRPISKTNPLPYTPFDTNGNSKDILIDYRLSDIDDASDPAYYGYLRMDGMWYIMEENSANNSYRYVRSHSDYLTNWTNRASQNYDYFDVVF